MVSRIPGNIRRGSTFHAQLNIPIFISITDIFFLYPIWRVTNCGFEDASGDYDLCMNEEETRLKFVLVAGAPGFFRYHYIPGYWLAKRGGIQKP